jgi:hypothetical protein
VDDVAERRRLEKKLQDLREALDQLREQPTFS